MDAERLTSSRPPAPPARLRGRPATPFLRQKILDAAAALFAEKEFGQVLIDDVAARAGVGKGSVYRQFASKERLYAAVVIEGLAELRNALHAALADCTSLRARIAAMVERILNFFWIRHESFAMLRDPRMLPRSQARRFRTERRDLSRLIRDVLAEGMKAGAVREDLDTQLAAEIVLGAMRGIVRNFRTETTPEAAARMVTALVLDGCVRKAGKRQPGENGSRRS